MEKNQYLRTVECFTMGSYEWECLPGMKKARYSAVADVLPRNVGFYSV